LLATCGKAEAGVIPVLREMKFQEEAAASAGGMPERLMNDESEIIAMLLRPLPGSWISGE